MRFFSSTVASSRASVLTWSFAFVTLSSIPKVIVPVFGEVKSFDGPLDASSQFVQFATTYLIDPGTIDLTDVKFIAVSDKYDADFLLNGDDQFSQDDEGHFTFATDDDLGEEDDFEDWEDDDDEDDDDDEGEAGDDYTGNDNTTGTETDDLTDAQDHEQNNFDSIENEFDDDGYENTTNTQVVNGEEGDEGGPMDIVDITEEGEGSDDVDVDTDVDTDAGTDQPLEDLLDEVADEIEKMKDEISNEVLDGDDLEEGDDYTNTTGLDEDTLDENLNDVLSEFVEEVEDEMKEVLGGEEEEDVDGEEDGSDNPEVIDAPDEDENESTVEDFLQDIINEVVEEVEDEMEDEDPLDFESTNSNVTTATDDDYETRRSLVSKTSTIDVLFFHEPSDCAKTSQGCDWIDLGIGMSDAQGNRQWCCTEDAMILKMCASDQLGRMIIDAKTYKGEHRFLSVPAEGDYEGTVAYPVMTTKSGNGQYTLLFANCNDYGRNVRISGEYVYKNKGGYLPGDLFDDWHFLMLLTFGYGSLLFWYGSSMRQYQDSTIGIQKWILGTVFLGLLETFFAVSDYAQWNRSGYRSNAIMLLSIFIGIFKGAIARCLLIMVSLGWGVIRDSLGEQMKKIVFLGLFYSAMAFLRDVAEIIFVEEVHVLSAEREEEIYDVFTIFTLITAAIDVIVYMWILDALNGTMQYLENMNQTRKLDRYLKLRLVLLLSILFGLFWTVLGLVNAFMDTAILSENQDWIIPGAWSANFFFILLAIAYLWRPDPNAKQLAYAMELSSNDDELGLEATTTGTISPDEYGDFHEEEGIMINKGVSS